MQNENNNQNNFCIFFLSPKVSKNYYVSGPSLCSVHGKWSLFLHRHFLWVNDYIHQQCQTKKKKKFLRKKNKEKLLSHHVVYRKREIFYFSFVLRIAKLRVSKEVKRNIPAVTNNIIE